MFMIIQDVLQIYYAEQCGHVGWILLLTSLLAENNVGACALRQSIKKCNKRLFKRRETLPLFSGVF